MLMKKCTRKQFAELKTLFTALFLFFPVIVDSHPPTDPEVAANSGSGFDESSSAATPESKNQARIIGRIISATASSIQINERTIPLSASGEFSFSADLPRGDFIDLRHHDLQWTLYLEPGKTVALSLTAGDLATLHYQGDLQPINEYLQKEAALNREINDFLNQQWISLHCRNEVQYIAVIDSLKGLFLNALFSFQEAEEDVSAHFIKLYRAEVEFGLNELILLYPQNHFRYTNDRVELSPAALQVVTIAAIDDPELIHRPSYNKFCKAWIDHYAEIAVAQSGEQKHYNLKKMDALFPLVPRLFKNQELVDYWLSEYLNEHVQNTWLVNSEKYIREFLSICQTDLYRSRIHDLYDSCREAEKDHVVKTYKSINGFSLQAHLFYPDDYRAGEKRATMVIFHGGGFVLGNPSWAFQSGRHYADLGMIAIAAHYRLSNYRDITPIAAIEDAQDLMLWLRANSDSLGIMSNLIAASGWSVGGQLCLTLAIFPAELPLQNIDTVPNALLLTSPGTDTRGWFTELLNGADIDPLQFSPVDHVAAGLPPTLILQGRDDTVTPLRDVQRLYDKMIAAGNACEMNIYDGVGHLFTPTALGDQGWPKPDPAIQSRANERAEGFLRGLGFIGEEVRR